MAFKICTIGKKGGVKKSTMARALAVEFIASNWSAAIADFDASQSTCYNWSAVRKKNEILPSVPVFKAVSVAQALHDLDDNYEVLIMDGGATASRMTEDMAKVSDLVVIPTGTSRDDLQATGRLALNLHRSGIDQQKIAIAFCPLTDNSNDLRQAKAFFNDFNFFIVPDHIPARPSYITALDNGQSITETAVPSLRKRAVKFIDSIANQLGKVTAC